MAEYLMPSHEKITIEEQRNIFQKEKKEICVCGEIENLKHIYQCKVWSENENENSIYENIFTDEISEQIKVNTKFQKNHQRQERHKLETKNNEEVKPHVVQIRDPLSSLFEYGDGL